MAIGGFAMLAVAVPALSQPEGSGDDFKKDEVFKVTTVIQVPAAAGNTAGTFFSFDISWFAPKLNKFFLTDRNNKAIDVVDAKNPGAGVKQQFFQAFAGVNPGGNDFSGPDGVLTANNDTELWVGDSPGKVWVLDSGTGNLVTLPGSPTNPISVGGTSRADELCYDPKDNIIMIASPAEGFVTFISAGAPNSAPKGKVLGQLKITTGTGIEQCAFNPKDGLFYQNVPNDPNPGDQVLVINPTTMKVVRTIDINVNDCSGVRGNAFGLDNQLLIGCSTPSPNKQRNSVVIDATSGKVLKVLMNLGGADEVWFNPDDNHYVIPSCNTPCRTVGANGTEQLGIVDSSGIRLDHSVTVAEQNGVMTPLPPPNPRTIHSAAAAGNQIFLPIPAVGGTAPQFDPTLCDSFDDSIVRVGSPRTSIGCIVILAAKKDDRAHVAKEREGDDSQN